MNLKDIDKLFNDNQHQFDKMPSDKLWERLEEKLDATPSMWEENSQAKKKVHWLRYVAAAAMILVMLIPAIYLMNNAPTKSSDLAMEQPAMYDETEAIGNSRATTKDSGRDTESAEAIVMDSEREGDLKSTERTARVEKKETASEEKIIAANETIRTKDKSAYTSKPTKSFNNNNNQQNKTRSIETPNPVAATPIPSSKDRSLKATRPNPPSKPSMTADADIAIEEEVMEMEADDAGETLDEVSITAYKSREATAKAATPKVKATFDITDTDGVYAYARYNADFQTSNFSNMLPYDRYGDERLSQSTLELESAKAGSQKKKTKSSPNRDTTKKDSASKEELFIQEGMPYIDFLRTLEGNWIYNLDSLTYTEKWTMNSNGSLQGIAKTLSNGVVVFEEEFSISSRQGKLIYVMDFPQKFTYPTVFTQRNENNVSNKKELVLENDRVEFPSKITYRLSTDTMLQITFEGQEEDRPITKQLIMYKE